MYDVIVIGVGSMGSSACYHLASRGAKVLGIEQFGISHENGSHTGESRLIRKAYFEHPDYVPLLHNTYQGWKQIEQASKSQLYWETGLAYFGLPECEMLDGVRRSAALYDISIGHLSDGQIKNMWPQFNLPNTYVGIWEPEAGFLTPEPAIQSLAALAVDKGAEIHTEEKVLDWSIDGVAKVRTNKAVYQAKKIIFTAGAFSQELIKAKVKLKVTQQFMGWTSPLGLNEYSLDNFPCWMISEEGKAGPFYGFPEIGERGMKIAYHREGEELLRDLATGALEEGERSILNALLQDYFPLISNKIEVMKRCKYTYSEDENFIVDQLAEYDNRVIIAAGFSGHGFKFVPVIGEALAELALNGGTDLPIDFLNIKRFE